MFTFSRYTTSACLALVFFMKASSAQEIDSKWELHLADPQHQPKTQATLQFTGEAVKSCMRGSWKRLDVDAIDGTDPAYFPLKEPMAYKIDNGVLTLARTRACNPYLLLTGLSVPLDMHGTYKAISIGHSRERGYFTLRDITHPPGEAEPSRQGAVAPGRHTPSAVSEPNPTQSADARAVHH